MQVLVEDDPVKLWLQGIENEKTRQTYSQSLRRLRDVTGLTPVQMLDEARTDMKRFWVRMKAEASSLRPHVRTLALCALRSYLRAHGEFPPFDRIRRPPRVRRSARITWTQALKICDAASPPYRYMFRMQLFCGWGIGEFFEWNQDENWKAAKVAIGEYPRPEYYLFQFQKRKSNDQPYHTLIPTFVLDDIFASHTALPLTSRSHGKRSSNVRGSTTAATTGPCALPEQ